MEKFFSKKWAAPLWLACLSSLVLLAYSNTINGAFQLDDTAWITDNPLIRNLALLPAMLRSQRALTLASFALNYAISGLDPRGYHLTNIAIHIFNAILVYILLAHTFVLAGMARPRAKMLSLLSASIFALHPVQTQAVTYIVQRMESLSATFVLLSLIAFIHAARAHGNQKKYLYYALTTLAYIAAFYSKEIALTLPALVLLYDIYFISQGSPKKILKTWPLYAALTLISLFFIINTVAPLGGFNDMSKETAQSTAPATARPDGRYANIPALQSLPTAGFGVTTTTPLQYFMTESNVLLYYYSLLILPMNQNLDYDFPASKGLFSLPKTDKGAHLTIPLPPPIVSMLIHLSLIALAVFLFFRSLRKKAPVNMCISFFIIWFFVILSPTSSFIPIIDVIFEHRLYLASMGYAVILTLIIEKIIISIQNKASATLSAQKH